MIRYLVLGTVLLGPSSGIAWNAIYRMLGRPWPTGWLLAMHCVIWPVGGAIWGWRMGHWKRLRDSAATSSPTEPK